MQIERKYGRWANLTASGFSIDRLDARVYHMIKSAFIDTPERQEGPTNINCKENGLATLKKVIDRYPNFPFSYIYLSACYRDKNNPEWRKYAKEAMRILKNTTKINDHHRHHDRMYEVVRGWLKDQ